MTAIEVTGTATARISRREVTAFARRVLRAVDRELESVSIAFVDDATMRNLNRRFRRRQKTTDVLTFLDERSCEIVISIDQARRQAAREKHALPTEIRYLILHGILHGLGYDHDTDQGEMDVLELEVREKLRLE